MRNALSALYNTLGPYFSALLLVTVVVSVVYNIVV